MTTYKFKPHVYSAPYAPYYDAYKGHTFKIDHYMEEDTIRKHVWLTGPVPVNGYIDLDDLEEVMPVFATNDHSVIANKGPLFDRPIATLKMKDKPLNKWGRDELLKLPIRAWDTDSEYDSLLIVNTRRKHGSGWAVMAIVGVRNRQPVEIACECCDDIEWTLSALVALRMDCAMRSGAMHAWARNGKFRVGTALSSVEIELLPG